jgi:hypothetical protein
MNLNWRRICGVFSSLSIIILLGGCATHPKESIESHSTSFNLIVEEEQNKMLLLNILRASKRRPMYFTEFQALRGDVSYSLETGALTIPFGRMNAGFDGAYSIAPKIAYTINPNFDLVVLNDQEFTRGIMTPVSIEIFDYYLDQGWPEEMLFLLFIEKMKIDGKPFENDPGKKEKLEEFKAEIKNVECDFDEYSQNDPIGPKIPKGDVDLEKLIEIQKTPGLTLEKVHDKLEYQLNSKRIEYTLICSPENKKEKKAGFEIAGIAPETKGIVATDKDKKIFLRSPEAILYYLGEIVRERMNMVSKLNSEEKKEGQNNDCPLFTVLKSKDDKAATVTVKYDGVDYMIPSHKPKAGCEKDNSMHVLSLVSQLIGLQKKAEKAPVTTVVK